MRSRPTVQTQLAPKPTDPYIEVVNVSVARLFPTHWIRRVLFVVLTGLAHASALHAEIGRVPPPRPELDGEPPPFPRPPEHARRPFELVSELGAALPGCQDGPASERCRALTPALATGFALLYRPYPYFAFGASGSYARSNGTSAVGPLDGEMFAFGASGRVYLYESGAFDPYLELELGYGSFSTTLVATGSAREQDSAFGPSARVGGGLDFVVLPALELGAAVGFSRLFLERGEHCASGLCTAGGGPGAAMVGSLVFALSAKLVLGEPL
jgi:hypothetical protein